MKRKKTIDIVQELINFQKTLEKKPKIEEMYNQIKMMNFRFKPIQGSLISFNFKNKKFIEALWSLGKLDEFFNKKIKQIKSINERQKFIEFFSKLFDFYQDKLNKVDIESLTIEKNPENLEIEIWRNNTKKN